MVTRQYGGFQGVDFRGDDIRLSRSPDSVNMWRDYKRLDSIQSRPSMVPVMETAPVHGIYSFRGDLLLHVGTQLYKNEISDESLIGEDLGEEISNGIVYDDTFYLMDGIEYYRYTGEGSIEAVIGYVPTTTIGRKPSGGGSRYEDINMLTGFRKNSFLSDGVSTEYLLDARDIDSSHLLKVTINGEDVDLAEVNIDYELGKLQFATPPPLPLTGGQDNVVVEFWKDVPGYRDIITGCRLMQVFDNRVFVAGNGAYPNSLFHCGLNDPTYFPDTDYYQDGLDKAMINGLVAGNNALWVFREPSDANTTVFYHAPTIDSEYGKIYPSAHSSVTTGCIAKAINFNDDIVFFSDRGMEGISGDITTEQVVSHRSSLVDRKLITDPAYKDMILAEWEGYLIVFCGQNAFLADSRSAWQNEDHLEYEWFFWDMGHAVTAAKVIDGVLYIGTDSGLYTLTGDGGVESWWTTPKDRFGAPNKQKTTNKRGFVAEATGTMDVLVKTENTAFELTDSFENVTDYITCRVKRKKFKDLQIKFYTQSRFSLEMVTLECFIGGYIKR